MLQLRRPVRLSVIARLHFQYHIIHATYNEDIGVRISRHASLENVGESPGGSSDALGVDLRYRLTMQTSPKTSTRTHVFAHFTAMSAHAR
jgi:hypothetical protein